MNLLNMQLEILETMIENETKAIENESIDFTEIICKLLNNNSDDIKDRLSFIDSFNETTGMLELWIDNKDFEVVKVSVIKIDEHVLCYIPIDDQFDVDNVVVASFSNVSMIEEKIKLINYIKEIKELEEKSKNKILIKENITKQVNSEVFYYVDSVNQLENEHVEPITSDVTYTDTLECNIEGIVPTTSMSKFFKTILG